MQLEVGKRYVRRDGEVTGPLAFTRTNHTYYSSHPFIDPDRGRTYRADGRFISDESICGADLISEYKEPRMQLEVGKRYVRRNGGITAPLELNDHYLYTFRELETDLTYTREGRYYHQHEDPADLIAEYKEPVLPPELSAPSSAPTSIALRDWFAGQALNGILSGSESAGSYETFSFAAYRYADAMLAARDMEHVKISNLKDENQALRAKLEKLQAMINE